MVKRKADKVASLTAAENSFEAVARKWWAHWKPARSEQHAAQAMRRFEANVFPHIGKRPVAQIQAPELVAMLKAIEVRGVSDVAKRAHQTSSQVFRYAIRRLAYKASRNACTVSFTALHELGSCAPILYALMENPG